MNISFVGPGLLLLLGASVTGCAAKEALHTDVSSAAIRSAEELGARDVPQASLHLQLAEEELQAATELQAKGEKEEAASLLLRAEADAELAVALSRVETERAAAQAAIDRVRKLRSENPSVTGGAQ